MLVLMQISKTWCLHNVETFDFVLNDSCQCFPSIYVFVESYRHLQNDKRKSLLLHVVNYKILCPKNCAIVSLCKWTVPEARTVGVCNQFVAALLINQFSAYSVPLCETPNCRVSICFLRASADVCVTVRAAYVLPRGGPQIVGVYFFLLLN